MVFVLLHGAQPHDFMSCLLALFGLGFCGFPRHAAILIKEQDTQPQNWSRLPLRTSCIRLKLCAKGLAHVSWPLAFRLGVAPVGPHVFQQG
jgi:hypothetical protein